MVGGNSWQWILGVRIAVKMSIPRPTLFNIVWRKIKIIRSLKRIDQISDILKMIRNSN
jgi:hypothetical protein